MKKHFALFLALLLLLWGCASPDPQPTGTTPSDPTDTTTTTEKQQVADTDDAFTDRDQSGTYDEPKAAHIELNGTSISCSSNAVIIDGTAVTITDEGTYILSGTLDDGMVIVDTDKENKVQLVLDGASITSTSCAPIYVRQADKVFITLEEGTENRLVNGGMFESIDDNNIDAVIFSKEDLTLNGSGSLTIESPAGHGIVSKDELTVTGGTYTVTTASHGLNGKDNVCISGGSFTIAAGKDGIQSDNADDTDLGFVYITGGSFRISAEGDGISASGTLQIDGGDFDIVSGGGSVNGESHSSGHWGGFGGGPGGMGGGPGGRPGGRSSDTSTTETDDSTSMKGIKADGDLAINGGTFIMDCADDAVHSNTNMNVTGGTFTVATGDDGFHAEENLTVSNGSITVTESYEGLEALHILVSGGDIRLTASDDGLNAAGGTDQSGMGGRDQMFGGRPGGMGAGNGSITISGGNLYVKASGDGIDANGTLEITGGYTVVVGPTRGDTATLDYDTSAIISGGTFIGTGAAGIAQTFSDSENQGVIAVQVGSAAAGSRIILTDAQGNTVIDYTPELDFNVVILSSPEIRSGESYTITVGDSSGTFEAN